MEDKQNNLNKILYLSIGIILLFLALLFSIIAFIQKKDRVYFWRLRQTWLNAGLSGNGPQIPGTPPAGKRLWSVFRSALWGDTVPGRKSCSFP